MRTILAAGLIVAATLATAAAPAQAACFYNRTNIEEIEINLDCGASCTEKITLSYGAQTCHAGKGGTFEVRAGGRGGFSMTGLVHSHGYVTIDGSCERGVTIATWIAGHMYSESKAAGRGESCN